MESGAWVFLLPYYIQGRSQGCKNATLQSLPFFLRSEHRVVLVWLLSQQYRCQPVFPHIYISGTLRGKALIERMFSKEVSKEGIDTVFVQITGGYSLWYKILTEATRVCE